MKITHRLIPELPQRPRSMSVAQTLRRSYPSGRQEFCRGFALSPLDLTLSVDSTTPPEAQVDLVTSINAPPGDRTTVPFSRADASTFTCRITPNKPGLYTFRARFSPDNGATWLQDSDPDAWILVDPPQVDHVRQYTLIPTVSGSIADWTADLPRIKGMGFNTVHLLPITTLDASQSPYSAHDLFSVDKSYLAPGDARDGLAQLEEFVEAAAQLEIRLCFDLVLNHVGAQSEIVQRAPDWIVPDPASPDGLRRARYWSDKGWLPWNDLVLIDYEHPLESTREEIWSYMTEYALFWGKYADYTNGFVRFDNLHSSDKNFVYSVARALRNDYPNLGIIAEYFTDNNTLLNTVPAWGLNLILATPWDYRFVPGLRDYLKHIHSVSEHVRFFMPITSHDSGTPAQEFGSTDSTIPRYVAAALLGTGATGITQGVEWGEKKKIEFIGRHARLAPGEAKYAKFIRKVNDIVAEYPTFRCGENCQFVDNGHHAVIAAFRRDKGSSKTGFLVVCNFDIMGPQQLEIDLTSILGAVQTVKCRDLLTGDVRNFESAKLSLVLDACDALVLRI